MPTRSIFAERFVAQGLAGPPERDSVDVSERLLAVQGQDPRGARLAVRARTEGLGAGDVDRALTEDRSLLITWLNRGTLHLVRSEDYPLLHALTTPPLATSAKRRLAAEGISPEDGERAVATIERALADEGPLTRLDLRERLEAAGIPLEGQSLIHLLFLTSLRGIAVRGPMVDGHHAYALTRDWLGPLEPVDRGAALAELARRYLVGHAPADDRDLARWAGLPLRDARAGLAAIASELVERDDGLLHLAACPPVAEVPAPRLIGAFDPVLLGWTSREAILGPHTQLVTTNGIFRPFAMVDGHAGRHLEAEPRQGHDRAAGPHHQDGRCGPRSRCGRRRAVHGDLSICSVRQRTHSARHERVVGSYRGSHGATHRTSHTAVC